MIAVRIPPPSLVDVEIVWQGLTFGDGRFAVNSLIGWLALPGAQFESEDSDGHGEAATPGRQGPRIVEAAGLIHGYAGSRNDLLAELRQAMVPRSSSDDTVDDLIITTAGVTAKADAQLVGYTVPMDPRVWASGVVPWSVRWRCPDPRVFGDWMYQQADLIGDTPGVVLPHLLPFLMTAKPLGGNVTLFNPGTDPEGSPVVIILTGPQSNVGVINVTTGKKLMYNLTLAAADQLRIDTQQGGAFLNGEYRPAAGFSAIVADLAAAPGPNVYRALGSAGGGNPSITVAVRPRSW